MKDEIICLIDRLVRFRTVQGNQEELKRCADFIEDYFKDENVFVRRYEKNGIPTLFISLHDTLKPEIILNAHFDVVPAGESMFTPSIQGDHIIGRGVYDDKGPMAILMIILKELSRKDKKPDVSLLVTGDEETGGLDGIGHALLEKKINARFAIIADGGSLNHYVTKAKGIMHLRLTALGIDAHGSRPWEGRNAVELLFNAHSRIRELFPHKRPDHWERTLNLGMIRAGDAVNKVPAEAEMTLDIRYTEKDDPQELLSSIENICNSLGNIDIELMEESEVFTSDEDNAYLQLLLETSKSIINENPVITADHGGSDARFFSAAGIPSVVTNPFGGNHHSQDEFLDTEKAVDFYNILWAFLKNISILDQAASAKVREGAL